MVKTVFEDIIDGKIPADKVFENERIIAIKDIAPVAPVHLLIMPKKNIKNIQMISNEDLPLIGEIITVAKMLAQEFGVAEGYRLLTNCGKAAGQTVYHLHFHLIGGAIMTHMA
jgi:histidine triad (HIT) family protein